MFDEICRDLATLMERGGAPHSQEAHEVIRRHFQWLSQFCTRNRDAHVGHAQLVVDLEDGFGLPRGLPSQFGANAGDIAHVVEFFCDGSGFGQVIGGRVWIPGGLEM